MSCKSNRLLPMQRSLSAGTVFSVTIVMMMLVRQLAAEPGDNNLSDDFKNGVVVGQAFGAMTSTALCMELLSELDKRENKVSAELDADTNPTVS